MAMLIRRRELIAGGWDPSKHNRVGGRIFYINTSSTGNTYKFYDVDGNKITDQSSITSLASAYYYDKTGSGADKFYVYDTINGLQTSKYWGYYDTSIGITTDSIGSGKTNTQKVLDKGVPTDYTPNIWGYIKDCRDSKLGGCDDWFIGSKAEQDQLRSSGLVTWYSSNYCWSSVEYSSLTAYRWHFSISGWYRNDKSNDFCCFAARAF